MNKYANWLVKQEPEVYSWNDFFKEKHTAWTGVRNFQARNYLQAMQKGDLVLFYHSVSEKRIVGVGEVIRTAYPDPTAKEGNWFCIDLKPKKPLPIPVTLDQIKNDPLLQEIPLIKQSRLSVMPLTKTQFYRICKLGKYPI